MKPLIFKTILSIFILLIIIIIGLLIFYKPGNRHSQPGTGSRNPEQPGSDRVFRKDGELQFRDQSDKLLVTIAVEVADNEEERMLGLMYRDSLPGMSGMLFMFENEEVQSFWMKNTRFSLDIIFINAERRIVSISKGTKPYSLASVSSAGPAMFVVEVPAGFSERYGISERCRVIF